MQRRNRKRRSGSHLIPVPLAVTLALASGLALCYLWLCERCEGLNRELKELESRQIALQKNYMDEDCRWSNLRTPANIDALLKRHGLTMSWPTQDQVVRLSEPRDRLSREVAEMARYRGLERIVMND